MVTKNASGSGSDSADVTAEDVRDLFDEQGTLNVEQVCEALRIHTPEAQAFLDRLVQSGICEKEYRSPVNGGSRWRLKHPHLRVRTTDEVAGEPPLSHKANFDGEPRDGEVDVEDVLRLLAEYEDRHTHVAPNMTATKLQITTRHALDLLLELEQRGVAEQVSHKGDGAKMFRLADSYTTDAVEELLGNPTPEPDPVDELDKALSD